VNLADAITTAIEFETRVRDLYAGSMNRLSDPVGQRVFQVLADEEQRHLDYLNHRLDEWKRTGKITVEALATALPSRDRILAAAATLEKRVEVPDRSAEVELLHKALAVETETSDFYQRMARELSAEGRQMFARFVEIEAGHKAIVQAELDYVTGTGFWFDVREFDLEAG